MDKISEEEFEKLFSNINNCFFIEVGANNGIEYDPIYHLVKKYNWKGILIEPNQVVFDELKKNYKDNDGLIFEKCIISEIDGEKDFYYNGEYTTLHNTLSYTYAKKHFGERLKIVKTPSLTFETLLKKHDVKKIDLLLTDVEGYDYDLLKTFPFNILKPNIIRCEYIHITDENHTLSDMQILLENEGYVTYVIDNTDIIAILK